MYGNGSGSTDPNKCGSDWIRIHITSAGYVPELAEVVRDPVSPPLPRRGLDQVPTKSGVNPTLLID